MSGSLRDATARCEVLVVGAGVSGLYAALLLARAGRRVRVIERGARAGGLAGAETFRGVPCDLGSHRLHPDAMEKPLFKEMARDCPFLERPRRGLLLLGDRRVPYPPSLTAMIRALGPRASLAFLAGRASRAWDGAPGEGEDVGFERFVKDRVGGPAYEAFYRPYAEKVWGLDPAELSRTVAKKRVSTTAPWRLLAGAAGRSLRAGFVYPDGGTHRIVAWLEDRLAALGVRVETGRAFDPGAPRPERTLYAGDLRDLVPTPLEHRGLYLVYLALQVARAGEAETYYTPDPRFWFGRVSEPQNYAPSLARPGETVLTVEIPEGRWGRQQDFAVGDRLEELCRQLVDAGIAPRGVRPIEARQRFVPGVYPLYRRGWLGPWREAMRRVEALGGIIPFGRQALFLHVNLDHCADIAADAVRHVEARGSVQAWIARAEGYLELRVRD